MARPGNARHGHAWQSKAWELQRRIAMVQFKVIEVWIEGTMPLLQNRFGEAAEASVPGGENARGQVRSSTPGETRSARDVATAAAYREPGTGALYVPGPAIGRMLREQGSSMKSKGSRKSLKYIVPAAVLVLSDTIPLYELDRKTRITKFEVDSRPVVIPATKGRVMRHRPKIPVWTARVELRISVELLTEATVRELFASGGACIGIGDYRPEKGGPFGVFDVVSWEEIAVSPARRKNGAVVANAP
jgi:hypothetical protein